MQFFLKTSLPHSKDFVQHHFGLALFKFLAPPEFVAKVVVYNGNKVGEKVHLKFGFPIYQNWISEITEEVDATDKYYFVDEGVELPVGLKKWRHIHSIVKVSESECEVHDDITFESKYWFLKPFHYLMIVVGFGQRKFLYPKYFNEISKG